jgi:hypothetical protein
MGDFLRATHVLQLRQRTKELVASDYGSMLGIALSIKELIGATGVHLQCLAGQITA